MVLSEPEYCKSCLKALDRQRFVEYDDDRLPLFSAPTKLERSFGSRIQVEGLKKNL